MPPVVSRYVHRFYLAPIYRVPWSVLRWSGLGVVLWSLSTAAGAPAVNQRSAHAAVKSASQAPGFSRQSLIGIWEAELPPKWEVIGKGFLDMGGDGTFRLIAVSKVSGAPVRAEIAGTWQLQGQVLTFTVTKTLDLPKLVGQSATCRILSLGATTFVLQDEDGTKGTLHRCRLPASLPPELSGPIILYTGQRELLQSAPRPAFPTEAAQRDLRGFGIYRLHVDVRNGVVRRVEVEQSTGNPILDKSAVTAFSKWFFKAPLLRQLQRRRDPLNTTGEVTVRVPWSFLHFGPSKHLGA